MQLLSSVLAWGVVLVSEEKNIDIFLLVTIALGIGAILLLPSLAFLYRLFKTSRRAA